MAIPTEAQISSALVNLVSGVVPAGRVWNRLRISDNDDDYKRFYVDDNGDGNVWMVYRIGMPAYELTSFNDVVMETHIYEFTYARAIVDLKNDEIESPTNQASHTIFQKQLEDVRLAINADKYAGLDHGTSHTGFRINQIQIGKLGAYEMHLATCQLTIQVQEC